MADLKELERRLSDATGGDRDLDAAIATLDTAGAGDTPPNYSSSVDECIALIGRVLPDWHWHVGHGPRGILPYATLTKDDTGDSPPRAESLAPTVPLALLRATLQAVSFPSNRRSKEK